MARLWCERLLRMRMPWKPGFGVARRVPRLAVAVVGVSGSIDHPLMQRFACEVDTITRRLDAGLDAGLVPVFGDDRVREV